MSIRITPRIDRLRGHWCSFRNLSLKPEMQVSVEKVARGDPNHVSLVEQFSITCLVGGKEELTSEGNTGG